MHIPDGYLSPITCVALYATATPFWYIALQKVKLLLNSRLVPLISLFAAFSFVIMMFNLPLPGGTTGHAVGMGISAIVLGPWASILAISIALLIQAIFFGDGGITTFGANAFNMGIVGSLTAYAVYRIVAGNSELISKRRVMAAALAGYGAINMSALLTAIEFGIQPIFFKDATGAPLYAPYPLTIAIPAMMIGHLTFAGLAELIVSGSVVAYLQRADFSLLKFTAPNAQIGTLENANATSWLGWQTMRPFWLGLALLMILSPLGLLAAGSAWGEWGPEELTDPATRSQIIAASGHQALPATPPVGMVRLAKFWTAPMPDYAPPFMHSPSFGYIMSAMLGSGLIILAILPISWIMRRRRATQELANSPTNNNAP